MLNEEKILMFDIPGKFLEFEQKTDGNINKTYVVKFENNGREEKYLIQQINNYVFKNPFEVMDNIANVTDFISKKLKEENDLIHENLRVIKTKKGKSLLVYKDKTGKEEFYRAYNYIDNSVCYNTSEDPEIVKNSGKAFGNFQRLLNDYPMDTLFETIKDFHNTPKRFEDFKKDVKENKLGIVDSVKEEIDYILSKEEFCSKIVKALDNKEIPYRVTHNDTKVNNVMMNKQTKDFVTVIDLDTVMPGSLLYDYGDGVRSTASNCSEDELDKEKIFLRIDLFESYTKGFLSELYKITTPKEVELMADSILIVTIELGMRFLNDYILGNVYFKTKYENHNIDRARNQINLAKDIEIKLPSMRQFILDEYNKFNK